MNFFKFSQKKVPMILQTEVGECGLACLAMVFHYHGFKMSLQSLRHLTKIGLQGFSMHQLVHWAQHFKYQSRVLRIELHHLRALKLPAILHWDMNHFVVLTKANQDQVVIHDPAGGIQILNYEQASDYFTGLVLELTPGEAVTLPEISHSLLSLRPFLKGCGPLKRKFLQVVGLALLLQVLSMFGPLYIQKMVDALSRSVSLHFLIFLALAFAGMKLLEVALNALRSYEISRLGASINVKVGVEVLAHLMRLPLSYFEKRHVMDVISRFNAIDKIRQIVTQGFTEGMIDGLLSLMTLIVMFCYSASLTLVVCISALLYALIRSVSFFKFRYANDKVMRESVAQNSFFVDMMRGIQALKIANKETARAELWKHKYQEFLHSNLKLSTQQIVFNLAKEAVVGVELIVVILIAAILILHQRFSIGMLYAFLFYRSQFVTVFVALVDRMLDYRLLSLYVERLADIVKEVAEVSDAQMTVDSAAILKSIRHMEVRDLSFRYSPTEAFIFKNISFEVREGETLVLLAPSGFGKTTLLKLMMGLWVPVEGDILINGFSLQVFDQNLYHQQIAAVMQEDHLFLGTLYDNISFFDPQLDRLWAETCAQQAGIHEDILKMPLGYYALIGDRGSLLSGGQKQRVLLARALYRRPQVLFLDEASSHLDFSKEQEVYRNLRNLPMIKIIVTHRPEAIQIADRKVRLDIEGFLR